MQPLTWGREPREEWRRTGRTVWFGLGAVLWAWNGKYLAELLPGAWSLLAVGPLLLSLWLMLATVRFGLLGAPMLGDRPAPRDPEPRA